MNKQDEAQISGIVEARLAELVKQQEAQFAEAMQAAIQGALSQLNASNLALEKERSTVLTMQAQVRELQAIAEANGEKMARDAYEMHRAQYEAATKLEFLRQLIRFHLENGENPSDICHWLNIDLEFVESIKQVLDRLKNLSH